MFGKSRFVKHFFVFNVNIYRFVIIGLLYSTFILILFINHELNNFRKQLSMMNKYKRIILLCCVVMFGGLSMYYQSGPASPGGQAATGAPFINGGMTCNN